MAGWSVGGGPAAQAVPRSPVRERARAIARAVVETLNRNRFRTFIVHLQYQVLASSSPFVLRWSQHEDSRSFTTSQNFGMHTRHFSTYPAAVSVKPWNPCPAC